MKSIKQISFVIVFAMTTILTSCSSDSGGSGGSATAGTIKAKAGSTDFTSMSQATFAMYQNNMLIIQGSDASGKAIQLILAGVSTAGTYQISDTASTSVVGSYTVANLSNPGASTTWAAPYDGSGAVGTV